MQEEDQDCRPAAEPADRPVHPPPDESRRAEGAAPQDRERLPHRAGGGAAQALSGSGGGRPGEAAGRKAGGQDGGVRRSHAAAGDLLRPAPHRGQLGGRQRQAGRLRGAGGLAPCEGGHRILLFSQFTSMLELLAKRLDDEGISHFTLQGSTPEAGRGRSWSGGSTAAR